MPPAAIAVGGTGAVTDALVSAGRRRGVEYYTHEPVAEIVRAGNRATGIRLASGSVVAADLVVSGLGAPQTLLELLPDHPLPHRVAHRLRNIHFDRGQLIWMNVAVHELPDYSAANSDTAIGEQPRL